MNRRFILNKILKNKESIIIPPPRDDKYIISFPRSGQHLFQDILRYVCEKHDIEYKFCKFYTCCKQIPCKHGGNFLKNHDYDNSIQIKPGKKFICLYRADIILVLESYYRYYIKCCNKKYNNREQEYFIKENKPYYLRFMEKWVNNDNENILKIEYYDLVKDPVKIITQTFNFIYPDLVLKEDIINDIPNIEFESHGHKSKIQIQNVLDPKMYDHIKSYI